MNENEKLARATAKKKLTKPEIAFWDKRKIETAIQRLFCFALGLPNGWRYPLVGGTRQRHFTGTSFKPRKLPENAQTPTSRVHAVLGGAAKETIRLAFGYIVR